MSPNKKGMEAVFHFLFSTLSPQQAKEEFKYYICAHLEFTRRFCWPTMDIKQEGAFKKAITAWLTRIEKVQSLLLSIL